MALYAASPSKFMPLSTLARLRESNYYNGDTGTELDQNEAESRYFQLIENKISQSKPWHYGDSPNNANDCPFAFFNEETTMGVVIKDMEMDSGDHQTTNDGSAKAIQDSINIAQFMTELNQSVQIATSEAVEKSMGYAETLSKKLCAQNEAMHADLVEKVRTQISGIAKPKVMAVEIDKVTRKLSKPANKFLGELIVNHGLGIHSMLIGPAGCGKTIAAGQLAEALGKSFGSLCLSAGASETWLFGRQTPNGFIEASFSKIYREGGVFLLDEMDAADANLLLSINTALANGFMFNPMNGETIIMHKDFNCVAGANTFGMGANASYTGRNRLDAATLTRFDKIEVDYDLDIEEAICPDEELRKALQNARTVIREERTDYIVSTRCLDKAFKQKSAGQSFSRVVQKLVVGWPEELVKKTGLKDIIDAKDSSYSKKAPKKTSSEFMPPAMGELF